MFKLSVAASPAGSMQVTATIDTAAVIPGSHGWTYDLVVFAVQAFLWLVLLLGAFRGICCARAKSPHSAVHAAQYWAWLDLLLSFLMAASAGILYLRYLLTQQIAAGLHADFGVYHDLDNAARPLLLK